jgi:hypothetical protein
LLVGPLALGNNGEEKRRAAGTGQQRGRPRPLALANSGEDQGRWHWATGGREEGAAAMLLREPLATLRG